MFSQKLLAWYSGSRDNGTCPTPRLVKISHEKDGRQRWPHSFQFPVTGSATDYFGLAIVHNRRSVLPALH